MCIFVAEAQIWLLLCFVLKMSKSNILDILPRKRHRITDGPMSNVRIALF